MKKLINKILLGLFAIFTVLIISACSKSVDTTEGTISILAPSGAPALSQVIIAHNASVDDNYEISGYNIDFTVASDSAAVTAALTSQTYDIIIAPVTSGATVYKSNGAYKYAANITDGNLYFAATFDFTIEDLKTANLVFFGESTINQVVVDKVLEYYDAVRDDITYLGSTSLTMQNLVADAEENTIYLVAEPVLSSARVNLASQNKEVYTLDVQEMFSEATDGMTFLQAGVFVKADLDEDFVKTYLEILEDNIDYINKNPDIASTYAEELDLGLPSASILTNAIPGCNLNFRSASSAKESLEALVNLNPDLFGGEITDDFYF